MTPRLRWSLVTPVLVVAGLFGMHGLGDHDAAHDAMAPMAAMTSLTSGVVDAAAPTAHQAAASASHDGMAGMAMPLCVAILLGGLLAAYVVAVAGRRTPWALPRLAPARAPSPRSRAPDPPTPALLSVYRC